MTYIYYEYPKCSTCRKAKAELTKLGVSLDVRDIKENPPSPDLLLTWLDKTDLPLKSLFNTSGNSYRELGLKDKFDSLSREEAVELLSKDGMLIKRPILIKNEAILQIGYKTPYSELNLD